MIRLLLRRGARLEARDDDGDDAEADARHNMCHDAAALLRDIRLAGGWDAYVLFPRKRVLALRVLCEQGRAFTDDALLRRLFPRRPLAPEVAAARVDAFVTLPGAAELLRRALDRAVADRPALADVVTGALAEAQLRALEAAAATPPKRPREAYGARDGGRLPKEIFWRVLEYWRSDRDAPSL